MCRMSDCKDSRGYAASHEWMDEGGGTRTRESTDVCIFMTKSTRAGRRSMESDRLLMTGSSSRAARVESFIDDPTRLRLRLRLHRRRSGSLSPQIYCLLRLRDDGRRRQTKHQKFASTRSERLGSPRT